MALNADKQVQKMIEWMTLLVDHSIAPMQYALNFIWENLLIL